MDEKRVIGPEEAAERLGGENKLRDALQRGYLRSIVKSERFPLFLAVRVDQAAEMLAAAKARRANAGTGAGSDVGHSGFIGGRTRADNFDSVYGPALGDNRVPRYTGQP